MKRILITLMAAFAIATAGASVTLAKQGDENLPCANGGLFILHDNTQENIDILIGRGLTFDKTVGENTHLIYGGAIDQSVFDAIMEGFEQVRGQQPPLVLSHCLEAEATPTPEVTPSPSDENPSPSPTTTPSPSVVPSTSPTPDASDVPSNAPSRTPKHASLPPTDMATTLLPSISLSNGGVAFILLGAFLIALAATGEALRHRRR